jgi:hypothetical protein
LGGVRAIVPDDLRGFSHIFPSLATVVFLAVDALMSFGRKAPPDQHRRRRGTVLRAAKRAAREGFVASLSLLLLVLSLSPRAADAHDWYWGLASPATGERCCTDRDCQAVGHRYSPEGHGLEVEIEGAWVPVAPGTLLPIPSPDGRAHACFWRRWTLDRRMVPEIRCVILPGEA